MTHEIEIRPPVEAEWEDILAVLRTRNFHHVGGPEMPSFPLSDCFVAVVDGAIRGVGGWRVLSDTEAKTTILAVHPDVARLGIGRRLQDARLAHLRSLGIRAVTTNTDDPNVIRWLEERYGFRRTGATVPKVSDFGDPSVPEWTTMRVEWP